MDQLVKDLLSLKEGKPGKRPELFGFHDSSEVVLFSQTEEGADLRMFVQLVPQHGERALYKAFKSAVAEESQADVVISTTHKAKGREWESVRIEKDFASSATQDDKPVSEEEVRLFYVAMTQAKSCLIVDHETLRFFQSSAWKRRPAAKTPAAESPATVPTSTAKIPPADSPAMRSTGTRDQASETPENIPRARKAPAVLPTRPPRPLSEILGPGPPVATDVGQALKEANAAAEKAVTPPANKQSLLAKFFGLFGG